MSGTLNSNRDFVIWIQNHWIPQKKFMFGTLNLSSFWKNNSNSRWILCLIQKHMMGCIWIHCLTQIATLTQNLLPLLGPMGHVFIASLSLGHYSLCNYFTALANNHRPNPPTSANNHRPTASDPLQQPMPATKPTVTHAHRHDPKSSSFFFFFAKTWTGSGATCWLRCSYEHPNFGRKIKKYGKK